MTNETIKAILIDPFNKLVVETRIAAHGKEHMNEIYAALKCDLITVASEINEQRDALFVDDEGLLMNDLSQQRFFALFLDGGETQIPLAGMGLIMGTNEDGESVDATVTAEEVQQMIAFIPNSMVLEQA